MGKHDYRVTLRQMARSGTGPPERKRLTGDEPLHSGGNPIRSEGPEFLAMVSIGFNRQYAAGHSRIKPWKGLQSAAG